MSLGRESRNNYAGVMRVVDASGNLLEPEHLDIRPTLVTIVHPDNQEFVPSPTDNWSRIAWRKLGDGRRWWIIADYSQVIDPFVDLQPQVRTRVLTRLNSDIAAGSISEITVKSTKGMTRGQEITVEDLNPSNLVSFTTHIIGFNPVTNVVHLQAVTAPAIPALLSRVTWLEKVQRKLRAPNVNRAFFEALGFGNPLNVLTDS